MKIAIHPAAPWYHGSPLALQELQSGSTVTQWRQLAEAFSHKPAMLCYDDNGQITHNGQEPGRLYVIDEPVQVGVDLLPHPRSTMDANAEYLTQRPLRLRLVGPPVNP